VLLPGQRRRQDQRVIDGGHLAAGGKLLCKAKQGSDRAEGIVVGLFCT